MAQAKPQQGAVGPNPWDNPANYKSCRKKFYEIYACFPPMNTVVVNKLEQADVVKQLGGRTFFTAEEISKMPPNNLALLQQLVQQGRAYAVNEKNRVVLCGTVGEMWTVTADKLASGYTFLQDGAPAPINEQTLQARSKRWAKEKICDWQVVRVALSAVQGGESMACFVPSSKRGQIQTSWGAVLNINGVGVSHGKGDFVLCAKMPNGQPNLADRWVVNGDIFGTTYNNQGWTEFLGNVPAAPVMTSLPKLIPDKSELASDLPDELTAIINSFAQDIQRGKFLYETPRGRVGCLLPGMRPQAESNAIENLKGVVDSSHLKFVCRVFDEAGGSTLLDVVYAGEDNVYLRSASVKSNDTVIKCKISQLQGDMSPMRWLGSLQDIGALSNSYGWATIDKKEESNLVEFTRDTEMYHRTMRAVAAGQTKGIDFDTWNKFGRAYAAAKSGSVNQITVYLAIGGEEKDIRRMEFTSMYLNYATALDHAVQVKKHPVVVHINGGTPCALSTNPNDIRLILPPGYIIHMIGSQRCAKGPSVYFAEIVYDPGFAQRANAVLSFNEGLSADFVIQRLEQYAYNNKDVSNRYNVQKASGKVLLSPKFMDESSSSRDGCVEATVVTRGADGVVCGVDVVCYPPSHEPVKKSFKLADVQSLSEVERYIATVCGKMSPKSVDKLFSYGTSLFSDVAREFYNEGYIILKQHLNNGAVKSENSRASSFSGSITITGDNDDNISLRILIGHDLTITVRGRTNKVNGEKKFNGNDPNISRQIFDAIVKKFDLDQFHRVIQAFNIVSRFSKVKCEFVMKDTLATGMAKATYKLGDKFVVVYLRDQEITFTSTEGQEYLRVSFFDNLNTMASKIAKTFFPSEG